MQECAEAHLQQSRISKFFHGRTPGPSAFQGGGREGQNGGRGIEKGKGKRGEGVGGRGKKGEMAGEARVGDRSDPPNKNLPLHHCKK